LIRSASRCESFLRKRDLEDDNLLHLAVALTGTGIGLTSPTQAGRPVVA